MDLISPKEFINTFYKDISKFLSKNFNKIGKSKRHVVQENVEQVFKQTTKSKKVFDTIAQEINMPVETITL